MRLLRLVAISIVIAIELSACVNKTDLGDCIGAFSNGDPSLKYELSGRNIGLAILFSEAVFPPIIVVLTKTKCPIARKP